MMPVELEDISEFTSAKLLPALPPGHPFKAMHIEGWDDANVRELKLYTEGLASTPLRVRRGATIHLHPGRELYMQLDLYSDNDGGADGGLRLLLLDDARE